MTTKALVLGCNGFCGRPLIEALQREPDVHTIGADLQSSSSFDLEDYFQLDITDWNRVAGTIKRLQPDWIFNLAGITSGDLRQQLDVNLVGAMHVLDAVHQRSLRSRVVLVGSAAEYGLVSREENPLSEGHNCRPVGPYGVSKHLMTVGALAHSREHGTDVVVMRPFNIVGPGVPANLVLGAVIERAALALEQDREPVVKTGNLEAIRDFVSVDDVIRSYLLAIRSDLKGEVLNVCSGIPLSVREVVEQTLSHAPRELTLEVDPELFKENDVPVAYGDPAKAQKMLDISCSRIGPALEAAWNARMAPAEIQ
jgi:GDP-4-dehydro-6-deoxy-D-mannose reductase